MTTAPLADIFAIETKWQLLKEERSHEKGLKKKCDTRVWADNEAAVQILCMCN